MEKTISQTIYNDFQDISPVSEKALKLFRENYGKIIEMLNDIRALNNVLPAYELSLGESLDKLRLA